MTYKPTYNARYIHFFINSNHERIWNTYDHLSVAKKEMEAHGGCIVKAHVWKEKGTL